MFLVCVCHVVLFSCWNVELFCRFWSRRKSLFWLISLDIWTLVIVLVGVESYMSIHFFVRIHLFNFHRNYCQKKHSINAKITSLVCRFVSACPYASQNGLIDFDATCLTNNYRPVLRYNNLGSWAWSATRRATTHIQNISENKRLTILIQTMKSVHRPLNAKSSIKVIEGRYTALTSSVVRIDALPPTVEILCDMQVPLANYYSRKRDIFYRGKFFSELKVNYFWYEYVKQKWQW